MTGNCWTAPNTQTAFLGVTAHWINVKEGKWALCSEVIGVKSILGGHNGDNLAGYFMGCATKSEYVGKMRQRYVMVIGFAQFAHDCYSYKQSHKITQLSIRQYVRL